MTKEEILERARKENKGADIVDLEIQSKSRGLAGTGALLLGAVLNLINDVKFDHGCPEFWVMFFSYSMLLGISNFVLSAKHNQDKKKWIWLFYGVFMLVMTITAILRLFSKLKVGNV